MASRLGRDTLLAFPSRLAAAVFLWVFANAALFPLFGITRYSRTAVAIGTALALGILLCAPRLLSRPAAWLEQHPATRRTMLSIGLVLTFLVQVRIGIAVRFYPSFDPGYIEDAALGLAAGTSVGDARVLLKWYPNNALLTSVEALYFKFLWSHGVVDRDVSLVFLNAAFLSAALAMTYLTARRLGGPVTAYLTLLPALALIGVSPWIGVVYSDTLGMVFPIGIAYAYVRARDAERGPTIALWWAAIGALSIVGYQIKPTALFAGLAAIGVSVLWGLRPRRGRLRVAALGTAGLLIGGVVGNAGVVRLVESTQLIPQLHASEQAFPITHFLMMGAQHQAGPYNEFYGAFVKADVDATALTPLTQRSANAVRIYRDRVSAMGPVGYLSFLNNKANWVMGDGTFFMYGEGGMSQKPTPFVRSDPTSQAIQRWLGFWGDRFPWTVTGWQSTWFAVLILIGLAAFGRRRDLADPGATQLRVSLLMLLGFLLFFEARSRYLYLYLPYFLILAAVTATTLQQRFTRPAGVATSEPDAAGVVRPAAPGATQQHPEQLAEVQPEAEEGDRRDNETVDGIP